MIYLFLTLIGITAAVWVIIDAKTDFDLIEDLYPEYQELKKSPSESPSPASEADNQVSEALWSFK